MNSKFLKLLTALVPFVALMAIATMARAGVSGAIYTTTKDGTVVNGNIYPAKTDVYLNGGPQNKQDPGLVPDGCYYFQVTSPPGNGPIKLLSTDDIANRAILVLNGRVYGLGTCGGNRALGNLNNANGTLPVQLFPYDDTPNPGGEYKVWVTPVTAYDPINFRDTFGFDPSNSKTDNFKVRESACTTCPLQISCPEDVDVPCLAGPAEISQIVTYADPIVSGGTPFPDGSYLVTCDPPSGSSFAAGKTTLVTCTVTDANGATAQCTFNVTVDQCTGPSECIVSGLPALCGGATGTYSFSGEGTIVSYFWSVDGGASINGSNTDSSVSVTAPTAGGSFDVTLQIVDDAGTISMCSQPVVINPNPDATIKASSPVCAGSTGNTASVADAGLNANYSWGITGGTITGGQGTNSITWTAGTGTTVSLSITVTTAANCSAAGGATVTVNPLPVCNIIETAFTATTATLMETTPGVTYLWSTGATTSSITVGAGTYSVTITDKITGCSSSCSYKVCSLTPGGLTIGFWSNKNGQALETQADFTGLTGLNLRNLDGSNRDFTGSLSKNQSDLSTWLTNNSNASNMASQLSAQLAGTYLNVAHGKTISSLIVDGTRNVQQEIDYANSLLVDTDAVHHLCLTVGGSPLRTEQNRVMIILNSINNGGSFIQPGNCKP
jgi:hypothetical protein